MEEEEEPYIQCYQLWREKSLVDCEHDVRRNSEAVCVRFHVGLNEESRHHDSS